MQFYNVATATTFADIQWALVLGGFGLFLFGIKYMGDGLKSFSGEKIRDIIDKYTSSPLKGIIIGAGVTCVIQSSSGTTALTIGLIRSGLMTLEQGVGIIMGANIGTTITAFLIGLKISKYALYFVALGAIPIMFSNKKKTQYAGQILFGFGALFYGLDLMSSQLSMLADIPAFTDFATTLASNPIYGLLVGTVMTLVIQSSSAVIGILQAIYSTNVIPISVALPFLFGSNIGTTITAILASFGGSTASKRGAGFHVMFNVLGTLLFMILLQPFISLLVWLTAQFGFNGEMELAVAHGIFNIVTTVITYPFIGKLVSLVKKMIPTNEKEIQMDLSELNVNVVGLFPSHALGIAKAKTIEMGKLCGEALKQVELYFDSKSNQTYEAIRSIETAINTYDRKITDYLVLIAHEVLNDQDTATYVSMMKSVKDLERIGDHCVNLADFFEQVYDAKESFSDQATRDIKKMLSAVSEMIALSLETFEELNDDKRDSVEALEENLDKMNEKMKARHIVRVSNKEEKSDLVCTLFIDIISNIERMGDHAHNISESYFRVETDLED